jgi:hypothetical protein
MSYIGSTPTTQNFIAGTDSFNGTGSATNFTLSRFVNSPNDIQVVVNNVVQYPPNYSVSGNTLTISPAPSAGTNNVYVRYLSTTLQSITVPGGSSVVGNFGLSGNLQFLGSVQRITGDFSNATIANRVAFQTSTVNGQTSIGVLPNGTSTSANINLFGGTDPANASIAQLVNTGTEARLSATTTGTGSFLPMTFYTGGSERMRVDTSGNVGIGTSSPNSKLQVVGNGVFGSSGGGYDIVAVGSTNSVDIRLQAQGNVSLGSVGSISNHPFAFLTNNTEQARITTAGNVGIGTSSPNARLSLGTNVGTVGQPNQLVLYEDATLANRIGFGISSGLLNVVAGTGTSIAFYTNGANERARIDSSGNLLVGTTTSVGRGVFESNGASLAMLALRNSDTGSGAQAISLFYRNNNLTGSITNTNNATAYNINSDYRLKENVQPMTGALAKVAALKPCTYKWKIDNSDGEGFIAHELAEVCPDAVSGEKDAVNEDGSIKPQGIDTSFLVATLTAAIQEQQQMIETLQAEVASLKAKVGE